MDDANATTCTAIITQQMPAKQVLPVWFYNWLRWSSQVTSQEVGFVIATRVILSLLSTSVAGLQSNVCFPSDVLSSSMQWCSELLWSWAGRQLVTKRTVAGTTVM